MALILMLYMTDFSSCSKVEHKASFIPVETGDTRIDSRYLDIAYRMAQLAVDLQMIEDIPHFLRAKKKKMKHARFHKRQMRDSGSKMVAFVQKGTDENISDGKTFVTSEEDNKKYLITDPAWRTTLGVISAISVLSCCVISQLIIMWSRKSQLKLNKYYSRKKFEKDQLIQYITRE